MKKLPSEQFTLGIEEEFQIVNPATRELHSHIQQILEDGKMILKENVKPEMHQSVVEVGTDVCKNISEARREVIKLRTELAKLAGIGKTVVFDIEHAKPTVQLNTLLSVLKVLNIQCNFSSPLMQAYEAEQHETG